MYSQSIINQYSISHNNKLEKHNEILKNISQIIIDIEDKINKNNFEMETMKTMFLENIQIYHRILSIK